VFTSISNDAAQGFGAGVTAADPHATGTYTWDGIPYRQTAVTYTFSDGKGDFTGGAFTPVAWAILLVGTVLAGRLWRALLTAAHALPRRAGPPS
jgi:hypothetical protein